jgi:multidrug efflux pump subunit AcrB
VLVSIYFMFVSTPAELAPTEDQGIVLVYSTAAADTAPEQLTRYTGALVQGYKAIPEAEQSFLFNGSLGSGPASTSNTALSGIVLTPWSERSRTQAEVTSAVQMVANGVAGLQSAAFNLPPMPGAGEGLPVQFVLGSTNEPLEIYAKGQELLGAAYASGLFVFADLDVKFDRPQSTVRIDRDKAASLGIDMQRLGQELGVMLGGNYVNRFSIQGRSYKVIPQLKRTERLTADQLKDIYITGPEGKLVPLSTFATLETTTQPRDLKRFQQLNAVRIQGVIPPPVSLDKALSFLEKEAKQSLPKGYSVDYAGESRQLRKEGSKFLGVFLLSTILIYLVLAAQFESFRDPFVILAGSVPLALSGSLLFSFLGLTTLNIYSQVGLITLVGLIAKNGILIVEFANHLQMQGRSKLEAVIEAAGTRLRPILMTTAATVVGHLPLVFANGPGAGARNSIGIMLVTGMIIGTAFTLFVVPSVYMVVARKHERRVDEEVLANVAAGV